METYVKPKLISCAALLLLATLSPDRALAQRELTDIPVPDPVAELAAMQVAEGFEVNLFASDPDFSKPIHMNWDAQGLPLDRFESELPATQTWRRADRSDRRAGRYRRRRRIGQANGVR
ncbi:MAG: hypothetical protein R3C53_23645 [Pirellulaceae bacterium]